MLGSLIVYAGFIVALASAWFVIRPARWLLLTTRPRGFMMMAVGLALAGSGLFLLPAPESGIDRPQTRLDEFAPRWQFREFHATYIDAPPALVFHAIRQVRADEVWLFHTLTWMRRLGRPLPASLLSADDQPLITLATNSGFVTLADEAPRELVIGTIILAPPGERAPLSARAFTAQLPPGYALATMNFRVRPAGLNSSYVTTETRVFANSAGTRWRFAQYWRVIYPGSALIRRMWLRAIRKRATGSELRNS
jgi:hypothetical protein